MRHSLLAFVCSLLAAAGAAAQGDFVDSAALREADLVKAWQLHLPVVGDQITDAYLVDDQLYFGSADGWVYAVDAATGALRWAQNFTSGGYRLSRPTHVAGRTVIATPPAIVQYDRQYGTPIRKQALRFAAGTPAVSDGQRILIGGLDRRLYSFDVDAEYERWKIGVDSEMRSRPFVMGDYVYFASAGGTVYAGRTRDKMFHWRNRSPGEISADLAGDQNGLYVASRNRSLYLLDSELGGTRWRARFNGALHEPPVLTRELAYQFCPEEGLVAVETAVVGIEERVRWRLPAGRSLLTTHEDVAYVLSRDEQLLAVRIEDGKVLTAASTPGMTHVIPSPARPMLYLASRDGRVFCARLEDVPLVTAQAVVSAMSDGAGEAEEDEQPATETAVTPEPPPARLDTERVGPPIGGKSRVSREFQERERSGTP